MENKVDLSAILRNNSNLMLGRVLDLARISEMGDRQFQQFEKSVKQYFRETTESTINVLADCIENKNEFEVIK